MQKVYGYVRLSRDEDKGNYDSIVSQKNIIKDKAKELGYDIIDIFEDDNVSGYIFDRDGFNKINELIKEGNINVLITKDLSRIGRHNAKTLLFLEYLDDNEVQLILVSDDYDSFEDNDDIIGIKTWYNEMYIKDISKKITSNIRSKQKGKGFIVRETFGYIKNEDNKHQLIVDEVAAKIIKEIFNMYIGGMGYRTIANKLNERKTPTPSQYMNRQLGTNRPETDTWNAVHINRIIKNDIYIGNLRCNKTEKKKIKGKSYVNDKEEQIIHENHHEAIISKEDFELAQDIIKQRDIRGIRGKKEGKGINLFTGFLQCADCGSYMITHPKNERKTYICGNYHKHGRKVCQSHRISENELIDIILEQLEQLSYNSKEYLKQIDKNIEKLTTEKKRYNNLTRKLKNDIDNKENEIKNYSRQLAKNMITENIFIELTNETKQEINILKETLNDVLELKEQTATTKDTMIKSIDIIDEMVNKKDLQRKDLELFLDKIFVKQNNKNQTRGEKPKLVLDIRMKDTFDTMCYHNQVVMNTHWNSIISRLSSRLTEIYKEVSNE